MSVRCPNDSFRFEHVDEEDDDDEDEDDDVDDELLFIFLPFGVFVVELEVCVVAAPGCCGADDCDCPVG